MGGGRALRGNGSREFGRLGGWGVGGLRGGAIARLRILHKHSLVQSLDAQRSFIVKDATS